MASKRATRKRCIRPLLGKVYGNLGRRPTTGPLAFTFLDFLPGIQQFCDPIPVVLKNPSVAFMGGPDPSGHSLEEQAVQPVTGALAEEVLLDGPCNTSFRRSDVYLG